MSSVKNARVHGRSTGDDSSSAAPEGKNKKDLMDIVLDDAEDPVADTNTAILDSALRKYCRIFNSRFNNYQIISSSAAVTSK